MPRRRLPKDWKQRFLAKLTDCGVVHVACIESGIGRSAAYQHRQKDPDFAEAWDDALECATDSMIAEARRRAVVGVEEPVYYQGKLIGTTQKYSDSLLMFLIKARRPEYRDSQQSTEPESERQGLANPEAAKAALMAADKFLEEAAGGLKIAQET